MNSNNNNTTNNNNNFNYHSNYKTIELLLIKEKYFSIEQPWQILDLINKNEYQNFIKSINSILYNYNYLWSTLFTFSLSFIFFAMFRTSSILLAWFLQVIFMFISSIFFYKYQKYNSFTRFSLIQEKIMNFNRQKSLVGIPIQFCLLLKKKEEINYFSGVQDDITLILSYDDYNEEKYIRENNTQAENQYLINKSNNDNNDNNSSNSCAITNKDIEFKNNNNKNINNTTTTANGADIDEFISTFILPNVTMIGSESNV